MSERKRNQTELLGDVLGVSPSQINLVDALYEELSPLSRDILNLSFEGVSYKQIAMRLHVSESTVRTYHHKLVRNLEDILNGQAVSPSKRAYSDSTIRGQALRPPVTAEYLLYLFLGKEERDVLIGDLIEEYGKIKQRFTKQRADIWYYKQVGGSLFPLARRTLLKMGALVWLGRILRRLIS